MILTVSRLIMSEQNQEDTGAVCGGIEGPDSMYVKLISMDGHEFVLKREHALISKTITNMLSGPGKSMHITHTKQNAPLCFNDCRFLPLRVNATNSWPMLVF